jgi:hypothetical protein
MKQKREIQLSTVVRHRPRRPGEVSRPRTAIREFCLQCMGGPAADVASCTGRECPLWPLRFGDNQAPIDVIADELVYRGQEEFPESLVLNPIDPSTARRARLERAYMPSGDSPGRETEVG